MAMPLHGEISATPNRRGKEFDAGVSIGDAVFTGLTMQQSTDS
jgi:hypothetical protein